MNALKLDIKINDVEYQESLLSLMSLSYRLVAYASTMSAVSFVILHIFAYIFDMTKSSLNGAYVFLCAYIFVLYIYVILQIVLKFYFRWQSGEIFKKVTSDKDAKNKWISNFIRSQNITLANLIFASAYALLDSRELMLKKDLFCQQEKSLSAGEFIILLSVRQNLKIADWQFAIIKKNFINDGSLRISKPLLRKLKYRGFFTEKEVKIKIANMRKSTRVFWLNNLLSACVYGFAAFVIGYFSASIHRR